MYLKGPRILIVRTPLTFNQLPVNFKTFKSFNPIPPGLFEGDSAWGEGGGGRKVPAACNSKAINDNEMKFGGVVKDH